MTHVLKLIRDDDHLMLQIDGNYVRGWGYAEYGSLVQTEVSKVVSEICRLTGLTYEFEDL